MKDEEFLFTKYLFSRDNLNGMSNFLCGKIVEELNKKSELRKPGAFRVDSLLTDTNACYNSSGCCYILSNYENYENDDYEVSKVKSHKLYVPIIEKTAFAIRPVEECWNVKFDKIYNTLLRSMLVKENKIARTIKSAVKNTNDYLFILAIRHPLEALYTSDKDINKTGQVRKDLFVPAKNEGFCIFQQFGVAAFKL